MGLITALLSAVRLLVILFAASGSRQARDVEAERPVDEPPPTCGGAAPAAA